MKLLKWLAFTMVTSLMLNSCYCYCCGITEGPDTSESYSYSGTVVDDSSGLPIENAKVSFEATVFSECESWARETSDLTDENGHFVLSEVYDYGTENSIVVSADGYKDYYLRGTPSRGAETAGSSEGNVHRIETVCTGHEYPTVTGAPQYDGVLIGSDSIIIEGFTVSYRAERSDECINWSKKDTLVSANGGRFTFEFSDNWHGARHFFKFSKGGWESKEYVKYISHIGKIFKFYADTAGI